MPYITFVIPHWLYWGGLIVVPLIAMYIVRKQRGKQVDGIISKPIAYMLWLCGGFIGLHRFYAKSAWGFVYIPIFIVLLLCNVQVRKAVNVVSGANNEVSIAAFDVERAQKAIDKGKDGAQQKMDKAKQAMGRLQAVWRNADRPNRWIQRAEATGVEAAPVSSELHAERSYQEFVLDKIGHSLWSPPTAPELSAINANIIRS